MRLAANKPRSFEGLNGARHRRRPDAFCFREPSEA
jgi:hypothetical protein